MYDNLIFEMANSNAYGLVVFLLLTLILNWIRSILFARGD